MFLKLNTKLGGHTSLLEKCVAIEGLAGLRGQSFYENDIESE